MSAQWIWRSTSRLLFALKPDSTINFELEPQDRLFNLVFVQFVISANQIERVSGAEKRKDASQPRLEDAQDWWQLAVVIAGLPLSYLKSREGSW